MIEFLLGAAIITLIYQGVKLNKVSKQVEALKGNENEITTWIQRNDELVNNRIDQEINRNDRHFTDVVEYINQNLQQKENKKKFLKG
jgi:uncharacterized protein (DUF111 family)